MKNKRRVARPAAQQRTQAEVYAELFNRADIGFSQACRRFGVPEALAEIKLSSLEGNEALHAHLSLCEKASVNGDVFRAALAEWTRTTDTHKRRLLRAAAPEGQHPKERLRKTLLACQEDDSKRYSWLTLKTYRGVSQGQRGAFNVLYCEMANWALGHALYHADPELAHQVREADKYEAKMMQPDCGWVMDLWYAEGQSTFFISDKMMESAINTDAPDGDYSWEELKWPHPAFMLMFPSPFQLKFATGRADIFVMAVVMAKADKGKVPSVAALPAAEFGADTEIFKFPVVGDIEVCLIGRRFDSHGKEDLEEGRMLLMSGQEQVRGSLDVTRSSGLNSAVNANFYATLYTLLYIMVERPELVEYGGRDPHAVERKGKPVLWTPNYIGRTYVHPTRRSDASDEPGHGVRSHWRRGHWRNQQVGSRQGPRETWEYRKKWIERIHVIGKELK